MIFVCVCVHFVIKQQQVNSVNADMTDYIKLLPKKCIVLSQQNMLEPQILLVPDLFIHLFLRKKLIYNNGPILP